MDERGVTEADPRAAVVDNQDIAFFDSHLISHTNNIRRHP